ncbi:unnamed protein product [Angiostrongylus costaricensis]|uniref:DB domain-containing protein n=1 Tax=Angiostrongylus costaricensis TaxID=334426 RepID=A0A158PK26_ANGCS|nr:unnamed protein product [Angiostrongylus costaricensis]
MTDMGIRHLRLKTTIMLPDSPSPRAALALSDLQPQTGASTFAVGTGSGNWSTHGVGGVGGVGGDSFLDKNSNGGGLLGNNRQNIAYVVYLKLFLHLGLTGSGDDKCLTGCIDYVTEKCPHKLEKFDAIQDKKLFSDNKVKKADILRKLLQSSNQNPEGIKFKRIDEISNWLTVVVLSSDRKLLNQEYPINEVTDADLTVECGVEKSRPPYSPCLARKVVDDVFRSCCQQHVPETCHQLCTYEHREHVAAETLIAAVQQGGCDLKVGLLFCVIVFSITVATTLRLCLQYLAPILYCANQNRDNRKCCEFLGMASSELGVGDRCLRMCNVAPSGDRVGTVEKSDLVCLSNWNVMMYCARSGLRTFN